MTAARSLLGLTAVLFLAQAPLGAVARAQSRDPAAAEVLYRAGRTAASRQDWPTACAKLAESQRLDPAPGTLLNLADCEQHRGQLVLAWQHFVEAETALSKGDARKDFAHVRAAALEKRLPHLSVRLPAVAPASARAFRDGEELAPASLGEPFPVDPGEHVIVGRAEGHLDGRTVVKLAEGDAIEVAVAIGPPVAAPPAVVPEPRAAVVSPPAVSPPAVTTQPFAHAAPAPVAEGSAGRVAAGYALLSTGLAGLVAGGIFGGLALSKASTVRSTCGPAYATCTSASVDTASDGKTFQTVSTVGVFAGAALAGAGLIVLVTRPSSSKNAAFSLTPSGVALTGRF